MSENTLKVEKYRTNVNTTWNMLQKDLKSRDKLPIK